MSLAVWLIPYYLLNNFYETRVRTRRKTEVSFTKSFKITKANFEARSSWWSKSNIINIRWSAVVTWHWKNGINKRKTIVITVNFRFQYQQAPFFTDHVSLQKFSGLRTVPSTRKPPETIKFPRKYEYYSKIQGIGLRTYYIGPEKEIYCFDECYDRRQVYSS